MASGVTPKQIYQALTGAGASTIQAIGIMANGIAESGLDPETIGDQGTSFGTWQQHGAGYAGLVTGNPEADLAAQVKVLAQNGGFAAASGSNAGEAAGNFSANYERCVGCQSGGSEYNQRVANAATVAGWVSSGKWPTSAGSATASAQGSAASGTGTSSKDASCAWGFTIGGGGLGPISLPSADICFIRKSTIRHAAGAALMLAGGSVGMFGVILLAAFAFRASGAARTAGQIAGTVSPAARVYERQAGRHQVTRRARRPLSSLLTCGPPGNPLLTCGRPALDWAVPWPRMVPGEIPGQRKDTSDQIGGIRYPFAGWTERHETKRPRCSLVRRTRILLGARTPRPA